MISQILEDAINEQIKNELYSAYLYLSMSAYSEAINLPGFAHWLRTQSREEQGHALKFFDFLTDRGGRVVLQAIDQPPAEFESPLAMFEQVAEHEAKVTGMIHKLYELAVKENDYATQIELQWFITEQVEEEKNAGVIVEHLRDLGGSAGSMFMLDHRLGERK